MRNARERQACGVRVLFARVFACAPWRIECRSCLARQWDQPPGGGGALQLAGRGLTRALLSSSRCPRTPRPQPQHHPSALGRTRHCRSPQRGCATVGVAHWTLHAGAAPGPELQSAFLLILRQPWHNMGWRHARVMLQCAGGAQDNSPNQNIADVSVRVAGIVLSTAGSPRHKPGINLRDRQRH